MAACSVREHLRAQQRASKQGTAQLQTSPHMPYGPDALRKSSCTASMRTKRLEPAGADVGVHAGVGLLHQAAQLLRHGVQLVTQEI